MNTPSTLNPLICEAPVDTAYMVSCVVKFLARTAEDRAHDHADPLTAHESFGQQLILNCVAAALDYSRKPNGAEGGEA